jgi:hypothetical protein
MMAVAATIFIFLIVTFGIAIAAMTVFAIH